MNFWIIKPKFHLFCRTLQAYVWLGLLLAVTLNHVTSTSITSLSLSLSLPLPLTTTKATTTTTTTHTHPHTHNMINRLGFCIILNKKKKKKKNRKYWRRGRKGERAAARSLAMIATRRRARIRALEPRQRKWAFVFSCGQTRRSQHQVSPLPVACLVHGENRCGSADWG